jgi:hypothetical protein
MVNYKMPEAERRRNNPWDVSRASRYKGGLACENAYQASDYLDQEERADMLLLFVGLYTKQVAVVMMMMVLSGLLRSRTRMMMYGLSCESRNPSD